MRRASLAAGLACLGACTFSGLQGLTGGPTGGDQTDGGAGADASGDAGPDVGTDAEPAGPPIVVRQRHICPYMTKANAFSCAFPGPNAAGNAFLVHFYYNYKDPQLVTTTLTDDDANTYAFLDVGGVGCPAASQPGHVCCTTTIGNGTCQGWALATRVAVATKNPATVTFAISSLTTTSDVMGAEVLEIDGLADAPLDEGKAQGVSPGASISTPTITMSSSGELVIAGFAFYTSTSVLTLPVDWSVDQDNGYFAAVGLLTGGPAGTAYTAKGTITGMTQNGTATILALKRR
jgi:hypothetical protein